MEHDANENCNKDIMAEIDESLYDVSPYYESYRTMFEIEKELNEKAEKENKQPPKLKLVFDINAEVDKRRYNIPMVNEVAALIVLDENDDMPEGKGIAVHQYGKKLKTLSKWDRQTESMIYPIYFPTGQGGWTPKMKSGKCLEHDIVKKVNGKSVVVKSKCKKPCIDKVNHEKITANEYYRFLTATRLHEEMHKIRKIIKD
jgi:hypothetical protein